LKLKVSGEFPLNPLQLRPYLLSRSNWPHLSSPLN